MASPTTAHHRRLHRFALIVGAAAAVAAGALATTPAVADPGGPGAPVSSPTTPAPIADIVPVQNLTVLETTDTSVTITWDAPPWDNAVSVRRDGTEVAVLPGGSTAYTDTGLEPGTGYGYVVAAVPGPGQFAFSAGVTATTTGGGSGGEDCAITWTIVSDWGSGFHADVTVTNHGDTAVPSWSATWTWSGSQQVTSLWNATWSQSGQTVAASHASWNALIMPGGSTSFGLVATGPAETPDFGCSGA